MNKTFYGIIALWVIASLLCNADAADAAATASDGSKPKGTQSTNDVRSKLTMEDVQASVNIGQKVLAAAIVTNAAGSLFSIKSVSVDIRLDSDVKEVVSEAAARTKIELALRRNGI